MFPYSNQSPATVQIGSLVMSLQAATIASATTVSALVLVIALHKYVPFSVRFTLALSILLSGYITAYTVNCTVVGHCKVWAWFLTLLFILNIVTVTAAQTDDIKKIYKALQKSVKKSIKK